MKYYLYKAATEFGEGDQFFYILLQNGCLFTCLLKRRGISPSKGGRESWRRAFPFEGKKCIPRKGALSRKTADGSSWTV